MVWTTSFWKWQKSCIFSKAVLALSVHKVHIYLAQNKTTEQYIQVLHHPTPAVGFHLDPIIVWGNYLRILCARFRFRKDNISWDSESCRHLRWASAVSCLPCLSRAGYTELMQSLEGRMHEGCSVGCNLQPHWRTWDSSDAPFCFHDQFQC